MKIYILKAIPKLFDFFFSSVSLLASVAGVAGLVGVAGVACAACVTDEAGAAGAAGVASTLVADTSTVECWEVAGKGEAKGPDAGADGNGKGEPGGNAALLNWPSCVFIWPIKVLKACCIAYFWKKIKKENISKEWG